MNNLGRDIEKGEVVVLDKKGLRPEYHALEYRLFKCMDGFGMSAFTHGRAIFGEFVCDGEKCRMDGDRINEDETFTYQLEHGKFIIEQVVT